MSCGEHEAIAIRPDRVLGIEPEHSLPKRVHRVGAIPIGVPGWPELAC